MIATIGIICSICIIAVVILSQRTPTLPLQKKWGVSQGYGDPPLCLDCGASVGEETHADGCISENDPVEPFDIAAYNARWTCRECGYVARYPEQHDGRFNPCSKYAPYKREAWG